VTKQEEEYRILKAVLPHERWRWLQEHAPAELRGHWWLGLIESAEFDASPARGLPPDQTRVNVEFAVELIEMAQRDGMASYYAASRLALLASVMLKAGLLEGLPAAITPNELVRRIMDTFRLEKSKALAVAERLSHASPDEPADVESDALRDMNWVLPDLRTLLPYLSDDELASRVREWVDISGTLSGS